tara:strand:- start:1046 stop:2404 length:1359 start_codon:yes stop_codon:yes gene_type:complete
MMVIKNKTMKKHINKSIFVLTFFAILFTACEDVDIVQLDPNANTVVSLSTDNIVLTEDNAESNAVTVSWTLSDFGFDAAPSYTIMIDVTGGDFSESQLISAGSNYSYDFTVAELNNKLLSLGLNPNEESMVDFKLKTTLSSYQEMISESVSMTVTPFSSILDLSTNLGVVGSATPGGWGNPDIPDLPFYTTATADTYVAYVNLGNGEIKFRKDNLWAENYGDSGADGTLEANGDNIAVSEGSYKITVNMANLTYTIEPFTYGLVGSATTNGWDGPDMMLTYNSYADDWRTVVTLLEGEIKFRKDNSWTENYGDSGADGTLENGGDNIALSAGHYLIIFNPNNLTYSIENMDVWGLVGSATANGWDGPNQKFVPDFGINEDHYYIYGAVLSNGEIKVRQNDAWAVNYGSSSFNAASSTNDLDLSGSNIPVSAGTYNVTLNFSSSTPTITLHQW